MSRPTIEEYREQIREWDNQKLADHAGMEILGAAVMSSFRSNDGWHDECASAIYAEAKRRGNPDLYERGWNDAVRSQGHRSMVHKITIPLDVGDPTKAAA